MSKKSASKLFPEETKPMKEEDMNLPESLPEKEMEQKEELVSEAVEQKEEPVEPEVPDVAVATELPSDDIIDVEFKEIKKQRYRFNGDNNKILEINTRDLGISYRLKPAYEKLNALMEEVSKVFDNVPDEGEENLSPDKEDEIVTALKKLNDSMCEQLDYLFNADITRIFGDDGSMYDPIGGVFRYEHIIEKLAGFYETDLDKEFFNLKQRVEGRAEKYTKVKKATKKYHI